MSWSDIGEFIKICQQEGMWVILRPGPYVCAEWDFGGIPPYAETRAYVARVIRAFNKRKIAASLAVMANAN